MKDNSKTIEQLKNELNNIQLKLSDNQKFQQNFEMIFKEMLDAFALHEIICNNYGIPINYKFLKVNPAFEKMTGLKANDIIGKTILDIMPEVENNWIEIYGKVALFGESKRFEAYSKDLKKYFDVTAFSPTKNHFVTIFQDITERKKYITALQESEERFKRIINETYAGYFKLGIDGTYQDVNQAWLKMHGYLKREEVIGKHFSITQIDSNLNDAQKNVNNILNGQAIPFGEFSRLCKDGSIGYHNFSASPIIKNHQIVGLEGFLIDITDSKKALLLIEENRRLLEFEKKLLQSVMCNAKNVHLVYLDRNFNFLRVNETYASTCGYTPDEMIGKNHFNLYPNKENEAIFLKVRDSGIPFEVHDKPFLFPDQPERGLTYWDWTLSPIKDENGTVIGLVLSLIETTKRKLAEESLKESEARFRNILESVPSIAVQGYEIDGTVTYWNLASEKLYGYSSKEAIGKKLIELIIPDDMKNEVMKAIYQMAETGQSIPSSEMTLKRKDGNKVTVFSSHSLVKRSDNKMEFFCIDIDLSERKWMEEELLKARKLESVGILAGGIAHDFNNLLLAIQGYIELAKDDISLENHVKDYLLNALDSTKQASELTKRLIIFSRGGMSLKVKFNLAELVKNTVQNEMSILKDIEIKFFINDDLNEIFADEGQIRQVVKNITINAIEAMPKGGSFTIILKNVTINEKDKLPLSSGDYIRMSFIDTGIGISDNEKSLIFDPYYSTKQMGSEKGMGLGLSVCHAIISRHNGCIIIDSILNKGSTFHIYLPMNEKKNNLNISPVLNHSRNVKKRILLMDDEEVIRDMISKVLKNFGYSVETSKDGLETIFLYKNSFLSNTPYDLLILDLTVKSGIGGVETINRLLEINPLVKAIIVSGYSDDAVIENFNNYGFVGAITKPFEVKTLKNLIENII